MKRRSLNSTSMAEIEHGHAAAALALAGAQREVGAARQLVAGRAVQRRVREAER